MGTVSPPAPKTHCKGVLSKQSTDATLEGYPLIKAAIISFGATFFAVCCKGVAPKNLSGITNDDAGIKTFRNPAYSSLDTFFRTTLRTDKSTFSSASSACAYTSYLQTFSSTARPRHSINSTRLVAA